MVRSVTRREVLRRLGLGFLGVALATLGLANKAEAEPYRCQCRKSNYRCDRYGYGEFYDCLSFRDGCCSRHSEV
jgi:hypothetical protein